MKIDPSAIASFVANGLFAQLAQILLLRELLVVLDGDELALGVMLAAWLVWVGIGAALGMWHMRSAKPGRRYAIVLMLAVASLPAGLVLIRLARPLFDAPLGTPLPLPDATILAFGSAAVPCFCIGMLFPLMVRETAIRPALVYGAEGAGALLGGLLFTFVLIGQASPLMIAAGAGALSLLAASWLVSTIIAVSRRLPWALVTLAAILCVVSICGGQIDELSEQRRWDRLLPGYRLVETRESAYARYALLESAGQYSLYCDGQHSCDLPAPHAGTFLVHTALLQHPAPRKVLIVTGDPVAGVRETNRHRPNRVDCVALDPVPLNLLRKHTPADCFTVLDKANVNLYEADPIRYLAETSACYDAILLDVPDPTTLGLNRYYSREFIELAADRLNPGGVLALTISSQENYLGEELLARNALVYRTLRTVLPRTIATPGDTCLLLARKGEELSDWRLTLDTDRLDARRLERGIEAAALQALLYSDPFPAEQVWAVNNELAAWPGSPVSLSPLDWLDIADQPFHVPPLNPDGTANADLFPIAHWATRLVNLRKCEPQLLGIFNVLPDLVSYLLAGIIIATALIAICARTLLQRHPRLSARAVGLTISSGMVGFAGMALQMLILLWFQCRVGQVYIGLALLIAVFMAGLSIGSLVASRLRLSRVVLWFILAGLAVAGLFLPFMLSCVTTAFHAAALALTALLGAMLGVHFACCAALWPNKANTDSARVGSARWLYAADLLGAALAALLMAGVVIPVSGYTVAARWVAGFAVTGLFVVWLCLRPPSKVTRPA